MAGRRGFSRGRLHSAGLSRDWDKGPGGSGVTSLTATGSAIMGSGIFASGGEQTVIRTRGLFTAFLRGVGAGDGDGFHGAVGIGKTTRTSFVDVGVTAIPTPLE